MPDPGIYIPNNWRPRPYQRAAWDYMERGGKRCFLLYHRRAGKDDLGLNWTAVCAVTKPASYWHLLPEAAQARKAIWDSVNPHTGIRRIDQAFPVETRRKTVDHEMKIEFNNGSTWQVVGSDNYNSLVGATPHGIIFSEWALANPAAWAILRPILAENGGWAMFLTTPRGRNHAATFYETHLHDPEWFVQKLTAVDTGVFSPETLAQELREYVAEFGEDEGSARYQQEYMCDLNTTVPGSIFGKQLKDMEAQGRICSVPYDPAVPVRTAFDLGRTDDTAIWFYQTVKQEIHLIDFHSSSGKDVPFYAKLLQDKPYVYAKHFLPWDAVPSTLASPRSVVQQLGAFVGMEKIKIAPKLDGIDSIQAARVILPRCWADAERCKPGLDGLRAYQRIWDIERKAFKSEPLHNWASHPSDAFQYLALSYQEENPNAFKRDTYRNPTMNELWSKQSVHKESRI